MGLSVGGVRGPSAAERLAADYPDAEIWREVRTDGSHGDWIAELRIQLRAGDPETLGTLLAQVAQVRPVRGHDHTRP